MVVYFREKDYRLFEANSDTDGQAIGGLNFVVRNGYRLVSFVPLEGETFDGRGDGFGGYTALFERVK